MQQSYFTRKQRTTVLRNAESMMRRLCELEVATGHPVDFCEKELTDLIIQVADQFMQDSVCIDLDLDEPLYILGDLFGQYGDLLRIFEHLGFPPKARYLFLGNYVDRGNNSIELITFLFIHKLKFPKHIYMLRGNHECEFVSCQYGFLGECNRRFSKQLWRTFMNAFDCLPAAAIIENCILCVHSGLIPCLEKFSLSTLAKLRLFIVDSIRRPVSLTDNFLLTQLTWAEPMIDSRQWSPNPVGLGQNYGEDVVNNYCERFQLQMIIRGHDLLEKGYEFSAKGRLLSVFTAPNFSGQFRNLGAIVHLYRFLHAPDEIHGRIKVVRPTCKVTRNLVVYYPLVIEDSLVSPCLGKQSIESRKSVVSRTVRLVRRKPIHEDSTLEASTAA